MADNTDTELLDWLIAQEGVTLQREPKLATRPSALWYVRVGGTAVWDEDPRLAIAAIKELETNRTKAATKGE